MAALHAITVTCPRCGEPITVPVVLTAVDDPVDGRRRGAFELVVHVHTGADAIREHDCPTDYQPGRRAAA